MCVKCVEGGGGGGGGAIFQKMIIKYLVPGTDLGMGAPFFQKLVIRNWYCVPIWDGGVNTSGYTERRVGTRLVSIQNWYPPPPCCLLVDQKTSLEENHLP